MTEKNFKAIIGSMLFECSENGYNCEIQKFEQIAEQNRLFVHFEKEYLKDFYFIFTNDEPDKEDDNKYKFTVFVVPTSAKDYIFDELDKYTTIKLFVFGCENGIVGDSCGGVNFIKFLKTFKKQYKKYFYMSIIRYKNIYKIPTKKKANKFYKHYRPVE